MPHGSQQRPGWHHRNRAGGRRIVEDRRGLTRIGADGRGFPGLPPGVGGVLVSVPTTAGPQNRSLLPAPLSDTRRAGVPT
jgi:hypothetical protein